MGHRGYVAPKGLCFLNVLMKADILDSGYFGLKLVIFSLLLTNKV